MVVIIALLGYMWWLLGGVALGPNMKIEAALDQMMQVKAGKAKLVSFCCWCKRRGEVIMIQSYANFLSVLRCPLELPSG